MRKLLVLVAASLGFGLGASACNPVTPYAALVNGQTISQSELNSQLAAISGNQSDVSSIEAASQASGGAPVQITGSAPGTYNMTFAVEALDQDIEFALIDQEFHRRHLRLSAYERQSALSDLPAQLSGQGQAPVLLRDFPHSYVNTLVDRQAEILGLEADLAHVNLTPATIQAYYDGHRTEMVEACASRILVPSLPAAGQVLSDLAAGKSFAAEAAAQSQDKNSASAGGQLGCGTGVDFLQSFGPSFARAVATQALGVPGTPVLGAGGFDIIEVTQRQALSEAAAAPQIRQLLVSSSASSLNTLLGSALRTAHVVVDSRYGTWSAASAGGRSGVIPPVVPRVRSDATTAVP